jgi:hypothetical protein
MPVTFSAPVVLQSAEDVSGLGGPGCGTVAVCLQCMKRGGPRKMQGVWKTSFFCSLKKMT